MVLRNLARNFSNPLVGAGKWVMAEDTYEVDQIIGRRITSNGKEDYLARWQSYSPLLSTWEPINNFSDCQRTVTEFFNQHWPIPGTQATSVVHVAEKPKSVKAKQELLTLKALPAKKGKKLLRGINKDLKEEILRLQLESKSLLANRVGSLVEPSLTIDCTKIDQTNMRFNGELKNCGSPESRKGGIKRKLDDVDKALETPQQSLKISRANSPKHLRSVKEKCKTPKQSPHAKVKSRRAQHLIKRLSSPQKSKLTNDTHSNKKISLPSRLTRQTLPDCTATCILEEELIVTKENRCMYIRLCNEAKKNVINLQMCEKIISSLHNAGKEDISVVVITGSGSSFSYGWDLDQFKDLHQADRKDVLQKYRLMTRMLITCPKLLVAAVNGPAAGFGISLAGLCNIVLASNEATFQTKFSEWGHPPVGCCSYILPHLLGSKKAMSMILLNRKLSAVEAQLSGLVSEVMEPTDFPKELASNIQRLLSVPAQCLQDTKSMLHESKVQELANVNEEECDFFQKYIANDTTLNNILAKWQSSLGE